MNESTLNNMQARLIGLGIPSQVADAMWNAVSYYSDFLGFDQDGETTEWERGLLASVEEWANGNS